MSSRSKHTSGSSSNSESVPNYLPRSDPIPEDDHNELVKALEKKKKEHASKGSTVHISSPSSTRGIPTLSEVKSSLPSVSLVDDLAVATVPSSGANFIVQHTLQPKVITLKQEESNESKEDKKWHEYIISLIRKDIELNQNGVLDDLQEGYEKYCDAELLTKKAMSSNSRDQDWWRGFTIGIAHVCTKQLALKPKKKKYLS